MEPTNIPSGNKKNTALVVGAIVVVLIALGLYFSLTSENTDSPTDQTADDQYAPSDEYVQTINVKHQYKNGVHTYAGEIDLPTPCHALAYNVVKDTSIANAFSLVFSATSSSTVCAQVITSKAFKLGFEGPSDATVTATLNGKKIRLNIFEVKDGQDLDSFDIYIKG